MAAVQASMVDGLVSGLRQALREPEDDGEGLHEPSSTSSPSSARLQLQISALHKGFLALSDAFAESIDLSRQREAEWEARAAALQRQFDGKLAAAQALRDDYLQLGASHAVLQQQNARLEQRLSKLEAAVDGLDLRLTNATEQQEEFAWQLDESIRNEIPSTVALESRRWTARKLPRLLEQLLQKKLNDSLEGDADEESEGRALSVSSVEPNEVLEAPSDRGISLSHQRL